MTIHRAKGFRPGPIDHRDYPLRAAIRQIAAPQIVGSKFWYNRRVLNQGNEGACVGFGWTQSINCSPRPQNFNDSYARAVYYRARQLDEWPGENYDGTSVRAGAKSICEKGWITEFAYAQNILEMATWILNRGPVVIGVDWFEGMEDALRENDYFIRPEGQVTGGHCVCVDGVRWGLEGAYFRILNSWSDKWGMSGRARITTEDMATLLGTEYSAACTAVEKVA